MLLKWQMCEWIHPASFSPLFFGPGSLLWFPLSGGHHHLPSDPFILLVYLPSNHSAHSPLWFLLWVFSPSRAPSGMDHSMPYPYPWQWSETCILMFSWVPVSACSLHISYVTGDLPSLSLCLSLLHRETVSILTGYSEKQMRWSQQEFSQDLTQNKYEENTSQYYYCFCHYYCLQGCPILTIS